MDVLEATAIFMSEYVSMSPLICKKDLRHTIIQFYKRFFLMESMTHELGHLCVLYVVSW